MPAILLERESGQQVEFEEFACHQREAVNVLARAIHLRTNRMIGDLRVEISASTVVLRGHTRAYYYKQLASQAILAEMTGCSVINEIQVLYTSRGML